MGYLQNIRQNGVAYVGSSMEIRRIRMERRRFQAVHRAHSVGVFRTPVVLQIFRVWSLNAIQLQGNRKTQRIAFGRAAPKPQKNNAKNVALAGTKKQRVNVPAVQSRRRRSSSLNMTHWCLSWDREERIKRWLPGDPKVTFRQGDQTFHCDNQDSTLSQQTTLRIVFVNSLKPKDITYIYIYISFPKR